MITALLTAISLLVLFSVLISKVLCLARQSFFVTKNFLWSSLELVFSLFALGFLLVINITNAYHSTIDTLMLPVAFESSIYLYIGTFLFTIIGFLFIIELFTIIVNDIYEGRKQFMPSSKTNGYMNSANMRN